MANRYYRRSAVIAVGGFSKELQVMEDRELSWKLEKAGYGIEYTDVVFYHFLSPNRFKLRNVLYRTFTYGYYWNKLHHVHPDKTGISAFPVKIVAFATFLSLSYFFPHFLWILFASLLLWLAFRLYSARIRMQNCTMHMEKSMEKIGALMVIPFLVLLFNFFRDLGKLYAIFRS